MIIRAAKWIAGKALRLIPERVLGKILPGKFAFDPAQIPPPPVVPSAHIRLFIAPVNYAGQGWQWARAVTRFVPDAAAANMVCRTSTDFSHPADNVVPLGFYAASQRWQRLQRDAIIRNFTHVIVEAEKQPFGAPLDETVARQVKRLLRHELKVMMLCHGSDIRLPSRHIANNPDSPFLDALASAAPKLERIASDNRRLLDALKLPVFVSTPDLLLDVPYASWLPVVVDPETWESDQLPFQGGLPVVAHAPSSGSVKGSELIDPILHKLQREGLIKYDRVEGVPYRDMPSTYRNADIVIDQIRLGDYGVAACEAMAAGRVVVGHVSEHSRGVVEAQTGAEIPIVEATATDLEEVLRGMIANPETARELARDGKAFVEQVHSGKHAAAVLAPYLT